MKSLTIYATIGRENVNQNLFADSIVRKKIGPKYIPVKAHELQPGDQIAYADARANVSKAEVEQALLSGALGTVYQNAADTLYISNTNGKRIPRFSVEILKGIIPPDEFTDLERRVLQEHDGEDSFFDPTLYVADISDHSKLVSEDSLNNWVRGKVTAPQDWEQLKYLQEAGVVNSKLQTWYESKGGDEQENGFFQAYRLWMDAKAYSARYLGLENERKREGTNSEPSQSSGKLYDLRDILDTHFGKDKERSIRIATVKRTKPAAGKSTYTGTKMRKAGEFRRGFITTIDQDVPEIDLAALSFDGFLYSQILHDSMQQYLYNTNLLPELHSEANIQNFLAAMLPLTESGHDSQSLCAKLYLRDAKEKTGISIPELRKIAKNAHAVYDEHISRGFVSSNLGVDQSRFNEFRVQSHTVLETIPADFHTARDAYLQNQIELISNKILFEQQHQRNPTPKEERNFTDKASKQAFLRANKRFHNLSGTNFPPAYFLMPLANLTDSKLRSLDKKRKQPTLTIAQPAHQQYVAGLRAFRNQNPKPYITEDEVTQSALRNRVDPKILFKLIERLNFTE